MQHPNPLGSDVAFLHPSIKGDMIHHAVFFVEGIFMPKEVCYDNPENYVRGAL